MTKLYGYSLLNHEDYENSVELCSQYINGHHELFYKIMSNEMILCFDERYGELHYKPQELIDVFVKDLHSYKLIDIISNINLHPLNKSEIPGINSISSINPLLEYMQKNDTLSYNLAGNILCESYANDLAKVKAGEIHLKLLSLFGLGDLYMTTPRICQINALGTYYVLSNSVVREQIIQKLILKVPIVSTLFNNAKDGPVSIVKTLCEAGITGQTIKRRAFTVNKLLDFIKKSNDLDVYKLSSNIYE